MAQNEADIIQAALIHLGEAADAGNPNFSIARARLADIRDRLLAEYRWNFAMKLMFCTEGALPSGLPTGHSFPYVYNLPTNCIRVVGPADPNGHLTNYGISPSIVWKVVGQDIYATAQHKKTDGTVGLWIWYTYQETSVPRWDPLFAELLSVELAQALAFRATSNPQAMRLLDDRRIKLHRDAKIAAARENSPEVFRVEAGWLESRYNSLHMDDSRPYHGVVT